MGVKIANNAFSALAASVGTGDTSFAVTTGEGSRFPLLAPGDYFYATLIGPGSQLEIVKVTERNTDVLTVVRAQEGTSAKAFFSGDRVELRLTAQTIVDLVADAVAAATTE
jgi:hypothetical protein